MATDGIITRENIELPEPRDTKTSQAERSPKEITADTPHVFKPNSKNKCGTPGCKRSQDQHAGEHNFKCKVCGTIACRLAHKPLGSWERKKTDAGVFFARPGIYFDLDGTEDTSDTSRLRARGVGRSTLIKYVGQLREAWAQGKNGLLITGTDHPRFKGMKSCVRRRSDGTYTRSDDYGEWVPMPIDMSFDPLPKRDAIVRAADQTFATLSTRKMALDLVSEPYLSHVISPERAQYIAHAISELEQPDITDFDADFDDGDD